MEYFNADGFWKKVNKSNMENKSKYLRKINVHDYRDVWNEGSDSIKESKDIKTFVVEAYCLHDFLAFFYFEDKICIAAGDDDHWWLIETLPQEWVEEIKELVSEIEVKKIRQRRRRKK